MPQFLYIPLYVFYVVAFLLFINRGKFFNIPDVKKSHLAFFFLLKVVAGIVLTLVYTYYYTDPAKADIYRYFRDSKIISSILFAHPIDWLKIITGIGIYDNGTFGYLQGTLYFSHPAGDLITSNSLLIRIISLLNYFSLYNIYIDTLLFNCITFVALTGLFKALRQYFDAFPQILYWPLFLMPSVVFWSSGLLKEGLLFVGVALYIFYGARLAQNPNWKDIPGFVLGIMVAALTKIYVAGVMIFCWAFFPVPKSLRIYNSAIALKFVSYVVIILLTWHYCGNYLSSSILHKRNEFIQLAVAEHSHSVLDTTVANGGWASLVGLVPAALVNAGLRPFVWDKGPVLQLLFAIENCLFIASLVFLLLLYFKRPKGGKLSLALFCFCFALFNYLGIGITVPILGAIVHYRVIAMPFLLLSVLLITDLEKLKLHITALFSRL